MQLSILVDHLMCIKNTYWRKSLFNSQKAACLSVFIVSVFFFENLYLIFKPTINSTHNTTDIEVFSSSNIIVFYLKVCK